MRCPYRHEYDNVAEAIVWQTVQSNLPPLLAVVEAEIEREERQRG